MFENPDQHPQDSNQEPETREEEEMFYETVVCFLRIVLIVLLLWTFSNLSMLARLNSEIHALSSGRLISIQTTNATDRRITHE